MPVALEMVGRRFGRLVVVERAPNLPSGHRRWLCRCDCGGSSMTTTGNLRRGQAQSCGCLQAERAGQSNRVDIAGQRHGRLLVLSFVAMAKGGSQWLVRCDCGTEKILPIGELRPGGTRSCGCLLVERTIVAKLKHGHTAGGTVSPEFVTWCSMRNRCSNPNERGWHLYGGRGVRVCERWLKFENFLEDMGPRPSGMSLDRIDVHGNYEPGNCRWATPKQQSRNRRSNRRIEYDGRSQCLADWSDEFGVKWAFVHYGLKRGLSMAEIHARARALNHPEQVKAWKEAA